MDGYFVIVLCFCATSNVVSLEEPQCSKYHYEQQILSKQIRMDMRLEHLEKQLAMLGQNEVCKSCDDGWIGFQSSCYLFATINVEFELAERFCEIYGSHLVSIRDSRENDFIKSQVAELAAEKFWIGLTDEVTENTWRWIDTNEEAQFVNWGNGQPNGGKGANCGAIWHSFGNDFVDEPCTSRQFRPICKKRMT